MERRQDNAHTNEGIIALCVFVIAIRHPWMIEAAVYTLCAIMAVVTIVVCLEACGVFDFVAATFRFVKAATVSVFRFLWPVISYVLYMCAVMACLLAFCGIFVMFKNA